MKKHLTALILVYGIVGGASAETGWELRYDQPEGILQIHDSSVYPRTKKEYRGWRKVRTRMTYPAAQVDSGGQRYMSSETVNMVSCSDRMRQPVSETKYSGRFGKGKRVGSANWSNRRPIPILPGSTEELILGEANCSLLTGKWGTTAE